MDPTAVNWNITIDDFDSILHYADQSVWRTPDPSASDFDASKSPWMRGTYHETTTKGASVRFEITGPAVYIYGAKGPDFGSFEIQIDHYTGIFSAYSAQESGRPQVLYAASNLTYGHHMITLTNLGALPDYGIDKGGNGFWLDYIDTTIQVAPPGATARNQTFEETSSAITYDGVWGNNTGPVFSGGGTTFTNGDGASFKFTFKGSAIMILGDKKNDHGEYNVILDGGLPQGFNGISGCGGAFGMTCEQQVPTIKYLASNLDDSEHTVSLFNQAGQNDSFFDLDSIVVVVPSSYKPRTLNTDSVFVNSTTGGNTNGGNGTNSGGNTGAGAINHAPGMMSIMLLIFTLLFTVRSLRRS
ncbi:hypothetical protein BJ165DRAFT_1337721 [Panaeolus papilionaceus]|nr:hypothetical protein BJ165DRAFT_1337721 [Panaeolus papilionaceus]